MSAFKHKKLESIETVGEKLQRHRKHRGLSLEKAARQMQVNPRYLRILEHDDYKALPADIYTKNFLRQYASFLNLNPDMVVDLHKKEQAVYHKTSKSAEKPRKKYRQTFIGFFLKPHTIKVTALIVVCALVLGYLGASVNKIFAPPELIIKAPHEESIITTSRSIEIEGITEEEVELTINAKPILPDQDGRFTIPLDLQKGLNTIKITAKKKHSKVNTIYRQIIVTDEPATVDNNTKSESNS
jgi:cytoskeletal protein RodZ